MIKIKKKKEIIFVLFLSILFAVTVQQFPFYKGNSLHLLHAIKNMEFNKLQYDWIANQTNHLPLFTYFNYFLIKYFSINILYLLHFILLTVCPFFLFLTCKNQFSNLKNNYLSIIWFSFFILIYHEHSFFGGVAGQDVINEGYQPASFGVLFYTSIYLFLIKKEFFAIFFICLAASFHPTYVLHSGLLIVGIALYFFLNNEYKKMFKILLLYSIMILPITIYIIQNFLLIEKEIILEGQIIFLDRIPHHALISNWFSYKDIFSVLLYFVSLNLIDKKNRLFIPFLVFGFSSLFLSIVQFFLENNTLALAFPWRSSVILVPLSAMIVSSFLINKFFINRFNIKITSIILFSIVSIFFFTKNHFIKDLNKEFYTKLELTKKINKEFNSIERILIPVNLTYIRMNTGLPIFVDWKHHAFKYDEIINWKKRMDLAKNFFTSNDYNEQKVNLTKIIEIEKISHILIKKQNLNNDCENLINDDIYALINVQECYF